MNFSLYMTNQTIPVHFVFTRCDVFCIGATTYVNIVEVYVFCVDGFVLCVHFA